MSSSVPASGPSGLIGTASYSSGMPLIAPTVTGMLTEWVCPLSVPVRVAV